MRGVKEREIRGILKNKGLNISPVKYFGWVKDGPISRKIRGSHPRSAIGCKRPEPLTFFVNEEVLYESSNVPFQAAATGVRGFFVCSKIDPFVDLARVSAIYLFSNFAPVNSR